MSEIKHRLLDAKLLLEHGIIHMKETSRIGKLLAIHHAHQAVELSMRIRAEQFNENPLYFPELKKALKKHGVNIPYERNIDELNKTRTLTQHYGQSPEETTVIKLVTVAKEFLIDFWQKEFSVEYGNVSLASLIDDKEIRKLINDANESLIKEDFDKAVEQAVLVIYKTIWKLEAKFQPPVVSTHPLGAYPGYWTDFAWVVLSMPYASKFRELRKTTGIVYLPTSGGPVMQKMKEYKATKDDASFAISLCLEYALWIEQTYF